MNILLWQFLMQETGYRQWKQMDEIFSYLDEDMKLLIFTTIQKLYYLSDEGYEELQKTVEIYKADLEVDGE